MKPRIHIAFLLALIALGCPPLSWADFAMPPATYLTNSLVGVAKVADLNGDGHADLAYIYPPPSGFFPTLNVVSIRLGNGDGSLGAQSDFATGANPVDMAVADFNGDSRFDLVTVNGGASTVSVLLGNADSGLGVKTDFVTGNGPGKVVVADLNGDGRLDLVILNGANTVSVLLGNGDGSFGAKTDFATGTGPRDLAVADFNADGRLDLVTANVGANTVSVLLGHGDGSFSSKADFAAGNWPHQMVVADLNGDGRLDLTVSSLANNAVSVLLGNGDGSLAGKTDAGAALYGMKVADFNGDGRLDLIGANTSSEGYGSSLWWVAGKGDGSFQPPVELALGVRTDIYASTVADFDGDGIADIAANTFWDFEDEAHLPWVVAVFHGQVDGGFRPVFYNQGTGLPGGVISGDFNADGRLDLMAAGSNVWVGESYANVLLSSAQVPVLRGLGVSNTAYTTTTLTATSDKASTGYWVVVPRSTTTVPSSSLVKAGISDAIVTVVAHGSGAMAANTPASFAVSGLMPGYDYDYYIVAENNGNLSGVAKGASFTTQAALNDTGVTGAAVLDARYGRDAAAAAGQLTKIGGGAGGFDFTPLDASGQVIPLVDGVPSTPPTCVRDNVTGLIWQAASSWWWDWNWYPGIGENMCGYSSGWRYPTLRELLSIVDYGRSYPAIDTNFFPGTHSDDYWTGDLYSSDPTHYAWVVNLGNGTTNVGWRSDSRTSRLVRSAY